MKGIYLGAYTACHPNFDIVYQDINGNRDLPGDMLDINLVDYDFIICTPPCNYWSRANWRRNESEYSLKTMCLLPIMLRRLCNQDKPFIVENVRNDNMFRKMGLFGLNCYIHKVGRHTYWTNILLNTDDIIQKPIIIYENGKKKYMSSQNLCRKDRQGGLEVHEVIERFLQMIH